MRNALLACVLLVFGAAAAADAPSYDDLVARAQRGDSDVDYTALRMAYAQSAQYDPYAAKTRPLFSAAWQAFQAHDCATALKTLEDFFKINYVSIPMHFVRSDCLKDAGDQAGSDREGRIAHGLADSLIKSGDGKSPQTAYVVVTMSEEGFLLAMLGFHEEQQSLITSGGRMYDLIGGHDDKTGEPRSAYFDVSLVFAGVSRKANGNP